MKKDPLSTLTFIGKDYKGPTRCPRCRTMTWVGVDEKGKPYMCQKCWFDILNNPKKK